jgi:hypothetical protein
MRELIDDLARERFARLWREEHGASGADCSVRSCTSRMLRALHPVRVIEAWRSGPANDAAPEDGFVGHLGAYRRGSCK